MAASYPAAVKTFSAIVNGITKLVAALFNSPYDEITAIETELGTDPAGSVADVKTRLAVSLDDDGTTKNILGAWVSKSNNTVYQASTAGFVCAYANEAVSAAVIGYTDASNPPTTVIAKSSIQAGTYALAAMITMPVKLGDYWKVTGANIVNWIPLGS